jgi:hypothetical protein
VAVAAQNGRNNNRALAWLFEWMSNRIELKSSSTLAHPYKNSRHSFIGSFCFPASKVVLADFGDILPFFS